VTLASPFRKNLLIEWRDLVASKQGPKRSTTRHVLLTLSLHMQLDGSSCFPSVRLLAERTGLSERTVCTHLRAACEESWIRKIVKGKSGKGWRLHQYFPTIPVGAEPPSLRQSKRTESGAQGTEPDSINALKEVQSNSSYNSSSKNRNKSRYEKNFDVHPSSHRAIEALGRKLGIRARPGESYENYGLRLMQTQVRRSAGRK